MNAEPAPTLSLHRDLGAIRALGILKILHRYHQSGATLIPRTLISRQIRKIDMTARTAAARRIAAYRQ